MSCSYQAASKEEIYDLIDRVQNGDEYAKEEIVKKNTGLVKSIAVKFTGGSYELDDLLQIGFIGLLKAAQKFQTGYDVMFSTYAVPVILGEIKRYLRDDGKIKMSRQTKSGIKTLKQATEELSQKLNRSPKLSELSAHTGLNNETILSLMEAGDALHNFGSLDDTEVPEKVDLGRYREEEKNSIDLLMIKQMITQLKEKERQVIILRYFKDMTQQEVANLLGMSQVQVSRTEKKVLERMRETVL